MLWFIVASCLTQHNPSIYCTNPMILEVLKPNLIYSTYCAVLPGGSIGTLAPDFVYALSSTSLWLRKSAICLLCNMYIMMRLLGYSTFITSTTHSHVFHYFYFRCFTTVSHSLQTFHKILRMLFYVNICKKVNKIFQNGIQK